MKQNRRNAQNARAFQKVVKEYIARKQKTIVSIINPAVEVKVSPNKAAPTDSDFFADVELAWGEAISDDNLFWRSAEYYLLLDDKSKLTDGEQRDVTQKIGREFLKRKLYPVEKYFRSTK